MSNERPNIPNFNAEDDTQMSRLAKKSKEAPFMVIGIVGMLVACGIGAYQYKNRGKMDTSVYLMQMRVIAQGTVVGSLGIGMIYNMYDSFMKQRENKPED